MPLTSEVQTLLGVVNDGFPRVEQMTGAEARVVSAVGRPRPQECMLSVTEAYSSPAGSTIGRATMSPRSSTVGPGSAAAQHRDHRGGPAHSG